MRCLWSDSVDFPAEGLLWIKSEAKKGTGAIGFVPWPRVLADAAKGRVVVGTENGDLVAWALLGAPRVTRVVTQLWVRRDARRIRFASELLIAIAMRSVSEGCRVLQASCATDLEADRLWPAVGFVVAGTKKGGRSRGRLLKVWRRSLCHLPSLRRDGRA